MTMTTLGDLAQRLYTTFAATQELLKPEPARFQPTHWDELPEWRQEVWVTVAAEAVKVGVETQLEIERQDDERLRNDPDLQTSLDQMARGEGRVLTSEDLIDIPTAEEDEAPRLREIADQPRRFVRYRRDCE